MKISDKFRVQIRRSIMYALAIFVVTSAVALSLARVILPEIQGYRDGIQQRLGELIEQKVTIESVDARLIGLTPTLIFKGVHLLDQSGEKELISFDEAQLGIAVVESLMRKTLVPSNFVVVGTTIAVLQDKNGTFSIQGVDISGLGQADAKISKELADWLTKQASIGIEQGTIILSLYETKDIHRFENVKLTLRNSGERHQLNCSIRLPKYAGKQLEFAMDVNGELMQPEQWQGVLYAHSQEVQLSAFGIKPNFREYHVQQGKAGFTVWGELSKGGFKDLSGDIALYGTKIHNSKTQMVSNIDRLKGRFDWQGTSADWQLRMDGLEFSRGQSTWKESAITASWQKDNKDKSRFGLSVSYAKIDDMRQLFLESNIYSGEYVKLLEQSSPQGEVRDFVMDIQTDRQGRQKYRLTANLTNLGVESTDKSPGVFGLNAKLSFDQDVGKLSLKGNNVLFIQPSLFRQAIAFKHIESSLLLHKTDNGWLLSSDHLNAKNDDMDILAATSLFIPDKGRSKYMDMQLAFRHVDLNQLYKYLPTSMMKEKLVNWFDAGFLAGKITRADVSYRGWTSQFPFRQHNGAMSGRFHAKDTKLHYFKGWPELENLEAEAEFTSNNLVIKSLGATMHGGDIKNLVVRIDDFKRPILIASGDAYGSTHNGFHFFSKTPVGKRAKRFVSKTRFGGNIHTNMTFSVALDKKLAKQYKKRFSGYVETDDAEMYMMRERLDVTGIKGRVNFSEKKFHAEGISAKLLRGDTEISVSSKIVGIKPVMMISGKGSFDAVMLDRRFTKLGLMRLYGRVPWQGQITLGHLKASGKGRVPAKLWLKSNLQGVEIDLPEPFRKPAEISRPTMMRATFLPEIKTILNVQYGDRMSTEMRLNNNYFPARIEIGEMKLSAGKAKLPEKDEFRISGVVSNVDQYTWREVMQEHYNKYRKLRKRPIVEVPVIVDLAYANVPFDKTKAKPRKRYTSPVIMPAFKGQIREFVFAGKSIGKVEFDSRKDKHGLVFDKIRVSSDDMLYEGRMTWHFLNKWHRTRAQGQFTIGNLGKLMKRFGFPDKAEDGEGTVNIDLNWNNPFYVFRPGYTNGKLKIALEDGVVTAINPGAGRFLGLLNISNLPRRLLLDFKDAGSGFAYDDVTGNIELNKGIARTDDLLVNSPVANILAVGKVDLRNKQLDQLVTVTPQVAGTMPVVGGLLMGTGVIPLVWLIERLFGSDMDEALSQQYHIKGPWIKPVVERIDKEKDA